MLMVLVDHGVEAGGGHGKDGGDVMRCEEMGFEMCDDGVGASAEVVGGAGTFGLETIFGLLG